MAEVNKVDNEPKAAESEYLDFEWVLLMLDARRLGCTPDEIRTFFLSPAQPLGEKIT